MKKAGSQAYDEAHDIAARKIRLAPTEFACEILVSEDDIFRSQQVNIFLYLMLDFVSVINIIILKYHCFLSIAEKGDGRRPHICLLS